MMLSRRCSKHAVRSILQNPHLPKYWVHQFEANWLKVKVEEIHGLHHNLHWPLWCTWIYTCLVRLIRIRVFQSDMHVHTQSYTHMQAHTHARMQAQAQTRTPTHKHRQTHTHRHRHRHRRRHSYRHRTQTHSVTCVYKNECISMCTSRVRGYITSHTPWCCGAWQESTTKKIKNESNILAFNCLLLYLLVVDTPHDELCDTCEWLMSHIWMSHVTHSNESYHTCNWVMWEWRGSTDTQRITKSKPLLSNYFPLPIFLTCRGCAAHCITLHHTSTYCNTLPHIVTHCNTLQHTAADCTTLYHTATDCNRLQQTATDSNTLQRTATDGTTLQRTATHCSTLQHTAAHCNTLQHTATHCTTSLHLLVVDGGWTRTLASMSNTVKHLSRLTLWWVTADRSLKATSTPSSKSWMYKKGEKTSSSPITWHRYSKRTIGWLCPSSSRCKEVRGQPQRDWGRTSGAVCTCEEMERGHTLVKRQSWGPSNDGGPRMVNWES